jgi:hypothetical protein
MAPTQSRPRHRQGCMVSVTPRLRFTPGERNPGYQWTGGWVGLIAGLHSRSQRKNPFPLPGIGPGSPGLPVPSQTLH